MTINDYIISYIEEIMIKYGFENSLIENDLLLKKKLDEVKNLSERASLKLIFGEKIKDQQRSGKSLEDILPSMRMKRILEKLINKKVSYDDLQALIKEALNTDGATAKEISESIKKNPEIAEVINNQATESDKDEDFEEEFETGPNKEGKKSIGSELLK